MKKCEYLREHLFRDTYYSFNVKTDSSTNISIDNILTITDENGKVVFDSAWWGINGTTKAEFVSFKDIDRRSHGFWAKDAHNRSYWSGMEDCPAQMLLTLREVCSGRLITVDVREDIRYHAFGWGNMTAKRRDIISYVIHKYKHWELKDDKVEMKGVIDEIKSLM